MSLLLDIDIFNTWFSTQPQNIQNNYETIVNTTIQKYRDGNDDEKEEASNTLQKIKTCIEKENECYNICEIADQEIKKQTDKWSRITDAFNTLKQELEQTNNTRTIETLDIVTTKFLDLIRRFKETFDDQIQGDKYARLQELAWSSHRRAMCHQALQTGYYQIAVIFIIIIAISQAAAGGIGLSSLSGTNTTLKAVLVGVISLTGAIFTAIQAKVNPHTLANLHQISLNQYIAIVEEIRDYNYKLIAISNIEFLSLRRKLNDIRGNAPPIPDWIIMRRPKSKWCPVWFVCWWQCCFYVFPQRNPFVETEFTYLQRPYRDCAITIKDLNAPLPPPAMNRQQ